MEVHELGLKLARKVRQDKDWIPYDARYHLVITGKETPALAMTYKVSKKTKGWLHYNFIYRRYGWYRVRREI